MSIDTPTIEPPRVVVAPARFVTIELASTVTGLSPGAIRTKIAKAVWLEGRQSLRAGQENQHLSASQGSPGDEWRGGTCHATGNHGAHRQRPEPLRQRGAALLALPLVGRMGCQWHPRPLRAARRMPGAGDAARRLRVLRARAGRG